MLKTGFNLLGAGGTVVYTVAVMKDAGAFNAGCGSALKIKKRVEIRASLMDGRTLQAGAAGLLSGIQKLCAFSFANNCANWPYFSAPTLLQIAKNQ